MMNFYIDMKITQIYILFTPTYNIYIYIYIYIHAHIHAYYICICMCICVVLKDLHLSLFKTSTFMWMTICIRLRHFPQRQDKPIQKPDPKLIAFGP